MTGVSASAKRIALVVRKTASATTLKCNTYNDTKQIRCLSSSSGRGGETYGAADANNSGTKDKKIHLTKPTYSNDENLQSKSELSTRSRSEISSSEKAKDIHENSIGKAAAAPPTSASSTAEPATAIAEDIKAAADLLPKKDHEVTEVNSQEESSFLHRLQRLVQDNSGLTELEQLKASVEDASARFDNATHQVATCRLQVEDAQKAHDLAHKRHVNLLMRREDWSGDDAQSFVNITSEEVQTRQALLNAQASLKRAEDQAITTQHAYMDAMRKRYHEEQLWQDKWRLLGTYGTWSLIGINTMVFVGGQIVMQRREMNRLYHMEQLLVQHQEENQKAIMEHHQPQREGRQQTSASSDAALSSTGSKEHQVVEASHGSSAGGKSAEEKEAEAEQIAKSDIISMDPGVFTPIQKLKRGIENSLKDAPPIHAPSFAVGAVVSASCMLVLVLVKQR